MIFFFSGVVRFLATLIIFLTTLVRFLSRVVRNLTNLKIVFKDYEYAPTYIKISMTMSINKYIMNCTRNP